METKQFNAAEQSTRQSLNELVSHMGRPEHQLWTVCTSGQGPLLDGLASSCHLAQPGLPVLVLEWVRAIKPSLPRSPQIRRRLQHLLLWLGEWCTWCGMRLVYDTS